MPAPPKPTLPKAAEPRHGRNFDPWNSVALGHQRAETKGPGGWRESRTRKLQSQLAAGNSGGDRLSDAVGAGAEDFDEALGVLVPREARARAASSVVDMLRRPGTMSRGESSGSSRPGSRSPRDEREEGDDGAKRGADGTTTTTTTAGQEKAAPPRGQVNETREPGKIFDGLVIYVNGSTHPLISDHRLKHVLVENGARTSVHLGRRQVTHVILGRPSGPNGGAGGGLAGGKLEREIRRTGGCGVKYVGVEWVLESIKAGRRLPETRFANLKVASRGQPSVFGAFSRAAP